MFRLALDENISPSLVPDLWANKADTVHIRDRGLLGQSDYNVLRFAIDDKRAVVTKNAKHFKQLVAKESVHHGVISIPGKSIIGEQIKFIIAVLLWAQALNVFSFSFMNQFIEVDEVGNISSEEVYDSTLLVGEVPGVTRIYNC